MPNAENITLPDDEGKLQQMLSEKINELEQMQNDVDSYTAPDINNRLEEIKKLQKGIDERRESIKKANDEKQKAIDELKKQTKEMKRLQRSVKKAYREQQEGKDEIKKREHKDYKLSIDHKALKRLEGVTKSSFLALAKDVILIDGKPYDHTKITLSKERKSDFKRYIEHHAVLEVLGKRKYNVKHVYSKKQREELYELEISQTIDKPKK